MTSSASNPTGAPAPLTPHQARAAKRARIKAAGWVLLQVYIQPRHRARILDAIAYIHNPDNIPKIP
jgi:hypothetical protein